MNVDVHDPFDIAADPGLPTAARALDVYAVSRHLRDLAGKLGNPIRDLELREIRVIRHKPGRRCVIEYDIDYRIDPNGKKETTTLTGKLRSKGADWTAFRLLGELRQAGLNEDNPDGIAVPRPIGIIPELSLWLQEKVDGVPATILLAQRGGEALARRIARAMLALHATGVTTGRRHTIADELRILHDRLWRLALDFPAWSHKLDRLLSACHRLAATLAAPTDQSIHRDFYADHVLLAGSRLYLIDFDLSCTGDGALDGGNFLGHLIEQSLRVFGRPDALNNCQQALATELAELAGPEMCRRLEIFTSLTLARHVYLSTRLTGRQHLTEPLFALCEERLGPLLRRPLSSRNFANTVADTQ